MCVETNYTLAKKLALKTTTERLLRRNNRHARTCVCDIILEIKKKVPCKHPHVY